MLSGEPAAVARVPAPPGDRPGTVGLVGITIVLTFERQSRYFVSTLEVIDAMTVEAILNCASRSLIS